MGILANSENATLAAQSVKNFTDKLDAGKFHYAPAGFQTDFSELLRTYRPILESHAGTVLKKIAKLQT